MYIPKTQIVASSISKRLQTEHYKHPSELTWVVCIVPIFFHVHQLKTIKQKSTKKVDPHHTQTHTKVTVHKLFAHATKPHHQGTSMVTSSAPDVQLRLFHMAVGITMFLNLPMVLNSKSRSFQGLMDVISIYLPSYTLQLQRKAGL